MKKCYKCGRKEEENDQCACPAPEPKRCCDSCRNVFLKAGEKPVLMCKNIDCPTCHQAKPEEKKGNAECLCDPGGLSGHSIDCDFYQPHTHDLNCLCSPEKKEKCRDYDACAICYKFLPPSPVQEKECCTVCSETAGCLLNCKCHAPKKEKKCICTGVSDIKSVLTEGCPIHCPEKEKEECCENMCFHKTIEEYDKCRFKIIPPQPPSENWEEEFDRHWKEANAAEGLEARHENIKSFIAAKKKEWQSAAREEFVCRFAMEPREKIRELLDKERASVRASTLKEIRDGVIRRIMATPCVMEAQLFKDRITASVDKYFRLKKGEEKGNSSKQNP